MAKQIGRGRILQIDPSGGVLEGDCMNGSSVPPKKFRFTAENADPDLVLEDRVLFVEQMPPQNGEEGEAVNVVKIPASGGCL